MIELILSWVMLAPVLWNNGGSCTVDAYINCQMIQHVDIIKPEHAPIVISWRDKIRNQVKDERPEQIKTLRRLKDNNYITSYTQYSSYHRHEDQIRIIVVNRAKLDWNMIVHDPSSNVGHAMCVLAHNNDYWIVALGYGMGKWYKGYWLVPKWDANEFYSYTR